jgi:hypothetical protein
MRLKTGFCQGWCAEPWPRDPQLAGSLRGTCCCGTSACAGSLTAGLPLHLKDCASLLLVLHTPSAAQSAERGKQVCCCSQDPSQGICLQHCLWSRKVPSCMLLHHSNAVMVSAAAVLSCMYAAASTRQSVARCPAIRQKQNVCIMRLLLPSSPCTSPFSDGHVIDVPRRLNVIACIALALN